MDPSQGSLKIEELFIECISGVEDILVKQGANRQRKQIIKESVTCGTKVKMPVSIS